MTLAELKAELTPKLLKLFFEEIKKEESNIDIHGLCGHDVSNLLYAFTIEALVRICALYSQAAVPKFIPLLIDFSDKLFALTEDHAKLEHYDKSVKELRNMVVMKREETQP